MTEQKPKRQAPKELWIKAPKRATKGLEEIAKKHKIPASTLRQRIASELTLNLSMSQYDARAAAAEIVRERRSKADAELTELEGRSGAAAAPHWPHGIPPITFADATENEGGAGHSMPPADDEQPGAGA